MQIVEQNGRRFAVLTKIVRVPLDAILAVKRSPTGAGCAVVTDRGCNIVVDAYDDVVAAIFGAEGAGNVGR